MLVYKDKGPGAQGPTAEVCENPVAASWHHHGAVSAIPGSAQAPTHLLNILEHNLSF